MSTVAAVAPVEQPPCTSPSGVSSRVQPSASGGVLALARAWRELGGTEVVAAGIRWRGPGAEVLLFVLVALPVLWARSVRAVATTCGRVSDPLWGAIGWAGAVSQRRLARFADSHRHDWAAVQGALTRRLAADPATAVGPEGVIAVDSSTVEKRHGRQLPRRRPVYDSCTKRLVDGYEIVSVVAVDAEHAWPVVLSPAARPAGEAAPRRRRRARPGETPSKLDLALGGIAQAVAAGVAAQTVVGDGAFAVMWWLREVAALGRHWLVAVRQDRRLRSGAEIRAAHEWAGQVPLALVATGERGTTVWGGTLGDMTLLDRHCQRRGLACQFAYFERRNRHGLVVHRWYLVTSHLAWDTATLWQQWQWRWPIEEFHRAGKQHLALPDFHARTWEGVVAWLACTCLRAGLLCYLQAHDPALRDLSTEALVATLRQAACLVEVPTDAPPQIHWPPALTTPLEPPPKPSPLTWDSLWEPSGPHRVAPALDTLWPPEAA